MKEELISIVIPVYNCETKIKRCIESIIKQTYKNVEILLIDDGSKDDSLKICNEYAKKDKRIIVISKENGGPSSARNFGLQNATGKYIGFVDSDDYIESDMYAKLYNSIIKNNSDIAICDYVKEYENYKKKNNKQMHNEQVVECVQCGKKECLKFLLRQQVGWTNWNKLYKADTIKNANILFNQSIQIGEDGLFNFEVINSNSKIKISYINQKLYHYFILDCKKNDEKYNKKINDYFESLEKYIEIFEKNSIKMYSFMIDYICKYKKYLYLKNKKNKEINMDFEKIKENSEKYYNSLNFKEIGWKERVKLFTACHLTFFYSKFAG